MRTGRERDVMWIKDEVKGMTVNEGIVVTAYYRICVSFLFLFNYISFIWFFIYIFFCLFIFNVYFYWVSCIWVCS